MKLSLGEEPDIFRKRLERQDSRLKGKERKRYRKAFRIAMSAFGMVVHEKFKEYMNGLTVKVAAPNNKYTHVSALDFIKNRNAKIRILLPYVANEKYSVQAITLDALDFLNVPDKFTSYYYFITRHLAGGFRQVVPELFNHNVEGVNIFFDRLVDSDLELVRVYSQAQKSICIVSVVGLMGANNNENCYIELRSAFYNMWEKLMDIK